MGNLRSGGLVLAALAVELGEPDVPEGVDAFRRILHLSLLLALPGLRNPEDDLGFSTAKIHEFHLGRDAQTARCARQALVLIEEKRENA